jgi:hypothetical protein
VIGSLNSSPYLLARFVPYLNHQSSIRSDTLDFFRSLSRYTVGPQKDALLQQTDLIRVLLYVLSHESAPRLVTQGLLALERCFFHDARELREADLDVEWLEAETWWPRLNTHWLEYFFACDGESVVLALKDRFASNEAVVRQASCIENKYFALEIGQVKEWVDRATGQPEQQMNMFVI